MTSLLHLFLLLLISLSAVIKAVGSWHEDHNSNSSPSRDSASSSSHAGFTSYSPQHRYGNQDQGEPAHSQDSTVPGRETESDTWNRDKPPQSQLNYQDANRRPGTPRTEKLECGKDLYVSTNQIIDIQRSVQYGAQLLDGVYANSFDSCVASCCKYEGCDLALYKMDGVSETGKTCYFVHCGLPEHCHMVPNNGFKGGFIVEKPDYGSLLDDQTASKIKAGSPPTTPPPPSPPSSSPPPVAMTTTSSAPTTQATPLTEQMETTSSTSSSTNSEVPPTTTKTATEEEDVTKPVTTATDTTDSPPQTTSEHNDDQSQTVAPSNQTTHSSSSSTPPPSSSSSSSSSTATKQKNATIDNFTQEDPPPLGEEDMSECDKNGCDGSALIVVSVIGTVMILVLLVVAAVIGRRIYKMKTRRQYRNVDYLINGMYT